MKNLSYTANTLTLASRPTVARPVAVQCACGARATFRQFDSATNVSQNVCQSCKGAK